MRVWSFLLITIALVIYTAPQWRRRDPTVIRYKLWPLSAIRKSNVHTNPDGTIEVHAGSNPKQPVTRNNAPEPHIIDDNITTNLPCADYEIRDGEKCVEDTSHLLFHISTGGSRDHLAKTSLKVWGKKVHKYFVGSNAKKDEPGLLTHAIDGVQDDYGSTRHKFLGGIVMAHKQFAGQYKWLVILDDDTLLEPLIAARIARKYGDHTKLQVLGQLSGPENGLAGGGGGLVSHAFAQAFTNGGYETCKTHIGAGEFYWDKFLTRCNQHLGGQNIPAAFYSQPLCHYCSPFGLSERVATDFAEDGPASFHYGNSDALIIEYGNYFNEFVTCLDKKRRTQALLPPPPTPNALDGSKVYTTADVVLVVLNAKDPKDSWVAKTYPWKAVVGIKESEVCNYDAVRSRILESADAYWILVVTEDVLVVTHNLLSALNKSHHSNKIIMGHRNLENLNCLEMFGDPKVEPFPTLSYNVEKNVPASLYSKRSIAVVVSRGAVESVFKTTTQPKTDAWTIKEVARAHEIVTLYHNIGIYDRPPEVMCYPRHWCQYEKVIDSPISFGYVPDVRKPTLKKLYDCPTNDIYTCSTKYYGLHNVNSADRLRTASYTFM